MNGNERRLKIDSNPLGRTVIQVDGATAYDKKPFVAKDTIDFDIVPGKKATIRLKQISLRGMECDVMVDGRTTTLTSLASDGTVAKPVSAKQRAEFQVRSAGAAFLAGGIGSILLNYFELKDGSYYPKLLFVAPMLLLFGSIMLAKPNIDLSIAERKKGFFLALAAVGIVVGWLFEKWFVGTFGPQ